MITEVTYSRSQTRQIVQFEPVNIFFSAKAEVMEGEDPSKVYAELKALVDNEITIQDTMLTKSQEVARAGAKVVAENEAKKVIDGPF